MGSIGVDEMDGSWMTDPSEVAVHVADLLMEQDGLTQNEALVSFMSIYAVDARKRMRALHNGTGD